MFKITDGYKLELQTPWSYLAPQKKKKKNRQRKNRTNIMTLKVIEVGLAQCHLVDNQYEQKSDVLWNFTSDKSYGYLLNNLVF